MHFLLTILSATLTLGGVGGEQYLWLIILLIILSLWGLGGFFYRHQCLLRDRAFLMHEAIRNKDFSFTLPPSQGWMGKVFFGEYALQQTLNDLGKDINHLVVQNEVESWQRLTRVLTHEIMNATAPIRSISQAYLASPRIKGTEYEEGIRAIYDTSTGMAQFVDSYRKLTQLQKANITEFSLLPFIENIKALFSNVEWKTDIPSSVTINADENLLRQVLINIIKNAVEAGANRIHIGTPQSSIQSEAGRGHSSPSGRLGGDGGGSILISNDGAPIPPAVRRDIFVPFFTTKPSGNGIGLSLSRQLLMLQNMSLTLTETPVNGYHTTFLIESISH